MPKKKLIETQAEQSERFRKAVRDMVAAGELDPTEADEDFERIVQATLDARSNRRENTV